MYKGIITFVKDENLMLEFIHCTDVHLSLSFTPTLRDDISLAHGETRDRHVYLGWPDVALYSTAPCRAHCVVVAVAG